MKLIIALSCLGLAGLAAADTHKYCWCGYKESEGAGGGWYLFADPTNTACDRYKLRNKGSEQWNTCPDCTTTIKHNNDRVNPCTFDGFHLGGDEWDYYCGQISYAGGTYQGYCKND